MRDRESTSVTVDKICYVMVFLCRSYNRKMSSHFSTRQLQFSISNLNYIQDQYKHVDDYDTKRLCIADDKTLF